MERRTQVVDALREERETKQFVRVKVVRKTPGTAVAVREGQMCLVAGQRKVLPLAHVAARNGLEKRRQIEGGEHSSNLLTL